MPVWPLGFGLWARVESDGDAGEKAKKPKGPPTPDRAGEGVASKCCGRLDAARKLVSVLSIYLSCLADRVRLGRAGGERVNGDEFVRTRSRRARK